MTQPLADPDRGLCALLAPRPLREPLFALLEFDAELAAIARRVREPMLGRIRLAWWAEAIGATPAPHPVLEALARHGIDAERLKALVAAREREFDEAPLAALPDLEAWAEGTGGGLALAMLDVLGFGEGPVVAAGREVGTAWALVEAARFRPLPDPKVAAQAARERLERARRSLPRPPKAARPVLLAAALADGYLAELAGRGHDPRHPAVRRRGLGPLIRLAWRTLRGSY